MQTFLFQLLTSCSVFSFGMPAFKIKSLITYNFHYNDIQNSTNFSWNILNNNVVTEAEAIRVTSLFITFLGILGWFNPHVDERCHNLIFNTNVFHCKINNNDSCFPIPPTIVTHMYWKWSREVTQSPQVAFSPFL